MADVVPVTQMPSRNLRVCSPRSLVALVLAAQKLPALVAKIILRQLVRTIKLRMGVWVELHHGIIKVRPYM